MYTKEEYLSLWLELEFLLEKYFNAELNKEEILSLKEKITSFEEISKDPKIIEMNLNLSLSSNTI